MGTVANIWRHPIKSHGREALEQVTLSAGKTMPWDRHWAVTHAQSKFDPDNPVWVKCRNFMIGQSQPGLAGIWASLDEGAGQVTLRHISLGEITFNPENRKDVDRFLAWVAPLSADTTQAATGIVRVQDRGMTDSDYPSVSVMNHASHAAVSARMGGALEPERWRGNIWLDGLAPWEEMEWVGREIEVGQARLFVREAIPRCKHTMANPVTGKRDANPLDVLDQCFGHQDFGMNCEVITGGPLALGDQVRVL